MPIDDLNYSHVELATKNASGDIASVINNDPSAQHYLFYLKNYENSKIQVFISPGNTKLGLLPNFNLPARSFILNANGEDKQVVTCPGASKLCRQVCYAQKGQFVSSKKIQLEYAINYLASLRDDFVETMVYLIPKKEEETRRQWVNNYGREPQVQLFRLHTSGDFYSPEYAEKWLEIAKALPEVHFYAYTKAWVHFTKDDDVKDIGMTAARVNSLNERIMRVLKEVNQLPNFQILLSTDCTTGPIPDELLNEGFKEAGIDFTYGKDRGRRPALCKYQSSQRIIANDPRYKDATPEQLINAGALSTCDVCGFCWDKTKHKDLDVYFIEH